MEACERLLETSIFVEGYDTDCPNGESGAHRFGSDFLSDLFDGYTEENSSFEIVEDADNSIEVKDVPVWHMAMKIASQSLCEDPRDKVYGIQSLFGKHKQIETTYALPVREIYLASIKSNFEDMMQDSDYFMEGCVFLAAGMKLLGTQDVHQMFLLMLDKLAELRSKSAGPDAIQWEDFKSLLETEVLQGSISAI